MMKRIAQALAACALAGAMLAAQAQIAVTGVSAASFSTAGADKVRITVRTTQAGDIAVNLLTGDGDIARHLVLADRPAGEHTLVWDGRDDTGQPVPNEAYTPQAVLMSAGKTSVDDPRSRSGGEVLTGLAPRLTEEGDIGYELPGPARVLIRVGIKGGAMLRSLSVWAPHPEGRNLQRWNGFDEDGLIDLRGDRLAMLVTAFRLPEFSIITNGQPTSDYRNWRLARGFAEGPENASTDVSAQPPVRDGVRIARQHYMARYKDREPRITVQLTDRAGQPLAAESALPASVVVSVDLHPEDRWLMQEALYEVAFFVDGEFVSEEENGYVPIGWVWNAAKLPPGRHLLTVNVTGFSGRVGTRTLQVLR
jgi:hypothetical protein